MLAKLKTPVTPVVEPAIACVVFFIATAASDAVGIDQPPVDVSLNPELQTEQTVDEEQVVQLETEHASTVTFTSFRIGADVPEISELI